MSLATATEHVRTADGWTLALHRWIAADRDRERAADEMESRPIVLLHGFGANGFCFHDPAGYSLGRHLAERGLDAWIPELRGTRSSTPPAGCRCSHRRKHGGTSVTIADKLAHDVPAVLGHVLDRSESPDVDVVGHSLGGTLLFAHLARRPAPKVRRCVGIAAATRYRLALAARALAAAERARPLWLPLPDPLPLRRLCILGAQTRIVAPAHEHFNVANMEREVLLRMMREGVEDPSLRELRELGYGVDDAKQRSTETARRHRGARAAGTARAVGAASMAGPGWAGATGTELVGPLAAASVPLLLIGGTSDRHVSEEALRNVLDGWGAAHKRLCMVGTRSGARLDYGHTDLLLGPRARTEVFPLVVDWLTRPNDEPDAPSGAPPPLALERR